MSPWIDFICPDSESIKIEDCIAECRMSARCVSKPTLMLMSRRRMWKGKVSATQALNGTRYEYLRMMHDYGEKPVDRAFALLGTMHHLQHQKIDIPGTLAEEWMSDDIGTGMFDYYDAEEKTLWEYKTAGAYKVNRCLGKIRIDEPVPGEFYKSGKRKGEQKTKIVWSMGDPDTFDWRMQLSRYSWMLIDAGFPVEKIMVQVTVRDFGAIVARQYGLDRQIYLIPLELFPQDYVVDYYRTKQDALIHALETNEMPPPCNEHERWGGKRCERFCPIWEHCDVGIAAHRQMDEEEG